MISYCIFLVHSSVKNFQLLEQDSEFFTELAMVLDFGITYLLKTVGGKSENPADQKIYICFFIDNLIAKFVCIIKLT